MGRKKFVEIHEKYVDQKKLQMATYIIGKAYDKKILPRNIKKNYRTLIAKKKDCFLSEVKNPQTLGPLPRYLMVRPLAPSHPLLIDLHQLAGHCLASTDDSLAAAAVVSGLLLAHRTNPQRSAEGFTSRPPTAH